MARLRPAAAAAPPGLEPTRTPNPPAGGGGASTPPSPPPRPLTAPRLGLPGRGRRRRGLLELPCPCPILGLLRRHIQLGLRLALDHVREEVHELLQEVGVVREQEGDLVQHLLDPALLLLVGVQYLQELAVYLRVGSKSPLYGGHVVDGVIELDRRLRSLSNCCSMAGSSKK